MAERTIVADIPDDGTAVITGPPMTGKYRLFVSVLSHYCDRAGIVSTHAPAERVRTDFAEAPTERSIEQIGVIDCVRRPDGSSPPDDGLVHNVASPMNLTAIGVQFTELAETFRAAPVDGRTGVGVHSISQLLMFSPVESVYRFLRVLARQVSSNDWFGVAVLDDTTADDEAVQTIEHLYDTVLQTRERDDGTREFRIREETSALTDWAPLPI